MLFPYGLSLGDAAEAVQKTLHDWRTNDKVRRLWGRDAALWTGRDEASWLGWLGIVEEMRGRADEFRALASDAAGFRDVVLLGMGGSSLCPWVLRRTFGVVPGSPELHVLDSIVPAQIRAIGKIVDPERTLFVVASKSGGTVEPNVLLEHFFERTRRDGSRFVAITDPGSKLEQRAKGDRFRRIVPGVPSIGGRFSALSNFGMVPAALMGLDVPAFLARAEEMVRACREKEGNPGLLLGAVIGTLAQRGRDKLTIVASPEIASLGAWLEQLVAESTGKSGRGIVPVDDEPVGPPEAYGADRIFVYLRVESSPEHDEAVEAIERAGHPVIRIPIADPTDLGQEFFRWEFATAVAGSILGINPFDQPDVEAAKVGMRGVIAEFEREGRLPPERPLFVEEGLGFFADPANAKALRRGAVECLASHLARLRPGDYFAINAYVEMEPELHALLQDLRRAVRDEKRVATTLGYGPRFLHSTGQLHKGGPDTGLFLHITSEDAADLPIPGQRYGFGVLKRAQAQGDFEVLASRGRRLLRVHLGRDVRAGLAGLRAAVRVAVGRWGDGEMGRWGDREIGR